MDSFYEQDGARAWLEQYIAGRVQSGSSDKYLTTLRLDQLKVIKYGEPRSLRLTEEVEEGIREVEVRIPGIICSKTLPPQQRELCVSVTVLLRNSLINKGRSVAGDEQVRMLRQYVKLSGLGSSMFEGMGEKIKEIWQAFSNGAGQASILDIVFKAYDGEFAIDAHTRYFTDRRHAPSLKHEDIPTSVDPHRFLDSVRGPNFIYTQENSVEYCEQVEEEGSIRHVYMAPFHHPGLNVPRYQAISPEQFQVGDVVEVVAAFVGYPAGRDQYVLKVTMRSLCMVTAQFRQEAAERRHAFHHNASQMSSDKEGKRRRAVEPTYSGPLLRRQKLTSQAVENTRGMSTEASET
ncbi:hypothetical protein MD484_g8360, partial [Candolleomyces efflorescens]